MRSDSCVRTFTSRRRSASSELSARSSEALRTPARGLRNSCATSAAKASRSWIRRPTSWDSRPSARASSPISSLRCRPLYCSRGRPLGPSESADSRASCRRGRARPRANHSERTTASASDARSQRNSCTRTRSSARRMESVVRETTTAPMTEPSMSRIGTALARSRRCPSLDSCVCAPYLPESAERIADLGSGSASIPPEYEPSPGLEPSVRPRSAAANRQRRRPRR